jgi:CheY-like chemotaxis protein
MPDQDRQLDILLVEDHEPDVHLTIAAFLDAMVLNRIHVAKDGEEAIAFLKRTGDHTEAPLPDLVLLDLNLPKLDGFQVLTEMKSDPRLKKIPVIVISGSDRGIDRVRAYDLQIAGYLVKPADVDKYFAAIQSVKELWFHTLSLTPKEVDASA